MSLHFPYLLQQNDKPSQKFVFEIMFATFLVSSESSNFVVDLVVMATQ